MLLTDFSQASGDCAVTSDTVWCGKLMVTQFNFSLSLFFVLIPFVVVNVSLEEIFPIGREHDT